MLAREKQILTISSGASTVNAIGAVRPTLMLEVSVEGLQVAAVVDTVNHYFPISCTSGSRSVMVPTFIQPESGQVFHWYECHFFSRYHCPQS